MARISLPAEILAAYTATTYHFAGIDDPETAVQRILKGSDSIRSASISAFHIQRLRRLRGDATRTAGARRASLARFDARNLKAVNQ